MNFTPVFLKGSYVIEPKLLSDERGGFARTFCKMEFESIGHEGEFVQHNQSYNSFKGTIRGMHFQTPPYDEIKLVRCIRGSVFDVIIDIRSGSPTFLHHFSVELSETNKKMLYIPSGFAHGFQTLEDNTELVYCHSKYYTPEAYAGLNYADPRLNIQWPLKPTTISEKDKNITHIDPTFKGI